MWGWRNPKAEIELHSNSIYYSRRWGRTTCETDDGHIEAVVKCEIDGPSTRSKNPQLPLRRHFLEVASVKVTQGKRFACVELFLDGRRVAKKVIPRIIIDDRVNRSGPWEPGELEEVE